MIKNIRFIIILILLVISFYFLLSFSLFRARGVIVVSLDEINKCEGLREGSTITEMRGTAISSEEDFQNYLKNVKQGEYVSMVINNMPGGCIALNDSYLGITVRNVEKKGLKFGIDLVGGKISTFTSSQDLKKAKEILEKRVEVFRIPEASVFLEDKTIKVISLKDERLEPLLIKGNFETKILEEVKLKNNTGKIPVGLEDYTITLEEKKIKINGSYYEQDEHFTLNSIEFEVKNITNSSVYIEALIFTKKDIKQISTYSFVKYESSFKTYEFNIPIEISDEASQRFSKVIDRMPTTAEAGTIVLNGRLIYYLDGKEMSNLAIPFSMVGRKINSISILGFRESSEAATLDKNKIEASIRTENLEEIKLVKTEELKPTYEMFGFYFTAVFITIEALFFVLGFLRYRRINFSGLFLIFSLTQIFLIFGSIAMVQYSIENSWLINANTLAGILVITSFTLFQLILKLEKRIKKREISLGYKLKKIIGAPTLSNILLAFIAFVLLFTQFKTFSLSLISGFIFSFLLLVPLYDEIIRKST